MRYLLASLLLVASAACHPGQPVIGGDKLQVGGTIAGNVTASGESTALASRKVTATNTATNQKYESTTSSTGGYTIKVPEGSYRLDIELRAGETLAKRPEDVRIHNGDVDASRDFVVTVKSAAH